MVLKGVVSDPDAADTVRFAVEVRPLAGLSGAQMFLITLDGRHWRVRKAAQTAASLDPSFAAEAEAFIRSLR